MEDPVVSDEQERPLVSVLAADVAGLAQPPTLNPAGLPFKVLAPPVFERLVAEVVLYVDGLGQVRVYGRSGQAQDGLDIVGGPVGDRSVYQVRRIAELTPAALRKAVTDYAGAPGTPSEQRRFAARRFVLAAACTPDDTKVENELDSLQREYEGDLEIELYDGAELSRMLRHRGRLVAVFFGAAWAEAFCHFRVPDADAVPAGRLLLDDPIDILGHSETWGRAVAEEVGSPLASAEVYRSLAKQLRRAGMAPAAELVDRRRWGALAAGGEHAAAFELAVGLALDTYDAGRGGRGALRDAHGYLEHLGDVERAVLVVAEAVIGWADDGYDLTTVVAALDTAVAGGHRFGPALATRIAEQIISDDDPADDVEQLTIVLERAAQPAATDEDHIRVTLCLADLHVRGGSDPQDAFAAVVRRALRADLDEGLAALVLRRAGFALAHQGRVDDAVDRYRQSVQQSSSAGLGGDSRDALRALSALSDAPMGIAHNLDAVRAISSREALLGGSDGAALETLELLVEEKMPGALAHAQTWVRIERTNGALRDVWVARRRLGQVLARATEHVAAVEQFILAGSRDAAVESARDAGYCDVRRSLLAANLRRVQATAAAVARVQADVTADEVVDEISYTLLSIAQDASSALPYSQSPSKYALGALAALGARLPAATVEAMIDIVEPLLPRKPNTYRVVDDEIVAALVAGTRSADRELAGRAAALLVDAIGHGLSSAADRVIQLDQELPGLRSALHDRAENGDEEAIRVLAAWDEWHPYMANSAQAALDRLLAHPVGEPRSEFPIGVGAARGAQLLHAALGARGTEDVTARMDVVVEHLLRWAEDSFDVAESRRGAADAIAVLADRLPSALRRVACTRMLAVHDHPRWNEHDLLTHASLHPLSTFRIDVGSEQLPLACLRTAAALADEPEDVDAVRQRLRDAVLKDVGDRHAAPLLERALITLAAPAPLPLDQLAGHPATSVRRAAAFVWGRQDVADTDVSERLRQDAEVTVRLRLAHAVAHRVREGDRGQEVLVQHLRRDASFAVRNAAMTISLQGA